MGANLFAERAIPILDGPLRWPGIAAVYMDGKQVWPVIPDPIPPNAMRVGPGTDAVVWRICPSYSAEL